MDPVELRHRGAQILEPVLKPHGFAFAPGEVGKGSGGAFAQGAFVRGNHRLDFSVRHSLGLVDYRVGVQRITHEDYMRVVAERKNSYPGFSDDPLDGFKHLASDLKSFCAAFLMGTDAEFDALVAQAEESPRKKGLGALSNPR
jgi:hypothetical protein